MSHESMLLQLREDEEFFRRFTPQELAKELYNYLDRLSIEYVPDAVLPCINIMRAADIIGQVREGQTLIPVSDKLAAGVRKVAEITGLSIADLMNECAFAVERMAAETVWRGTWAWGTESFTLPTKKAAEGFAKRLRAHMDEPCSITIVQREGRGWGLHLAVARKRKGGAQ